MSVLRGGRIRSIGRAGGVSVEGPAHYDGNSCFLRSSAVSRGTFRSSQPTVRSLRVVCKTSVRASSTMVPIELYSLATPNGQKVSVALEEMGLPYNAHSVDLFKGGQFTPEFIAINPNSKIPAIVDPDGPDGKPLNVFESGAILLYLAEKSGKFLPSDLRLRSETLQWVFFQMGGVGPMFGQFGHFFKFAKEKCKDPYPLERYTNEAKRLLGVIEKRLEGRGYLVGDQYTIADMAIFPWITTLEINLAASDHLGLSNFPNVMAWRDRCRERPATAKGLTVLPFKLPES